MTNSTPLPACQPGYRTGYQRADSLDLSRWVALSLAALCLALAAGTAGHWIRRTVVDLPAALAAQHAIGLSEPAFAPSGRPLRLPWGRHRGVPLGFTPFLADSEGDAGAVIPEMTSRTVQ
ncbi:MAG: hypothetical protein ACOWWM_03910 [Desulfobacterales bacterium]